MLLCFDGEDSDYSNTARALAHFCRFRGLRCSPHLCFSRSEGCNSPSADNNLTEMDTIPRGLSPLARRRFVLFASLCSARYEEGRPIAVLASAAPGDVAVVSARLFRSVHSPTAAAASAPFGSTDAPLTLAEGGGVISRFRYIAVANAMGGLDAARGGRRGAGDATSHRSAG